MAKKEAKKSEPAEGKTIRIQYYRSFIAAPKTHKTIVRSVGLTKLNQVVDRPDTPSFRGVVAKVPHLLRIIE
jgi:large subunit ribosomal protein L30